MKTISNQDSVSAFSTNFTNATASAVNLRIFDNDGLLSAINGQMSTVGTNGTIAFDTNTNSTSATPIVISGFNYEVTSSATQFSKSFNIIRASVDGRLGKHPNVISKAKRNTQYDSKLLTIDERFVIDGQTGIEIAVNDSETITLTFLVEGFLV